MSKRPVTIPAKPRGVNLTAGELIDAVAEFLKLEGFGARSVGFEDVDPTTLTFYGVTENGEPWDSSRQIRCPLWGVSFRSVNTRIGSGPFEVTLKQSQTIDEMLAREPARMLFDVMAVPAPDRSITFHEIVSREGNTTTYRV